MCLAHLMPSTVWILYRNKNRQKGPFPDLNLSVCGAERCWAGGDRCWLVVSRTVRPHALRPEAFSKDTAVATSKGWVRL